jgi:predicted permease
LLYTVLNFTPILVFFCLGYAFKTLLNCPENTGQFLSKLILKVTIPATIFLSVNNTEHIRDSLLIPAAAFGLQVAMFGIFLYIAKKLALSRADECIVSAMPLIANTLVFMAPFFYLAYGDEGLTRVVLYYLGNAITIYFLAPIVYNAYGSQKLDLLSGLKTIYTSFPVWAFVLGLIWNALDLGIAEPVAKTLNILKESNVFLTMFFLGFRFMPRLNQGKLVFTAIALKNIFGFLAGVSVCLLFSNPLDKITIIMGAMAPVGVMGLIYAEVYLKDTHLASSLVSYSMVVGVIIYTILLSFFQAF